jgi:DNA repair exonuclease SbcCD ATPase subunit
MQNFAHTSKVFEQACIDLEVAQSNLQKFKNEQFNDESNSKVIESELNGLRQNLSTLKKEYDDHELLKTQINLFHSQIQKLEVLLETKNNRLKSMGENDNPDELLRIEAEIESLEEKKEILISEKGAAKRSCDDIFSANPYEAFEKAKVQLEIAKADHLTLKRITDSHKLLQDLFGNVQADLSIRYTKPLAQSIENFLKPLISDGPAAQLSFDPTDGFTGLKMRRGKEFYDFDQLSGGMKEQLTAALRLSMADVLKSEHDGCLPLVFDDAFTNSDPKRVEIIKIMLQSAVNKGLQVILLSCDPKAYEEFADKQILLD